MLYRHIVVSDTELRNSGSYRVVFPVCISVWLSEYTVSDLLVLIYTNFLNYLRFSKTYHYRFLRFVAGIYFQSLQIFTISDVLFRYLLSSQFGWLLPELRREREETRSEQKRSFILCNKFLQKLLRIPDLFPTCYTFSTRCYTSHCVKYILWLQKFCNTLRIVVYVHNFNLYMLHMYENICRLRNVSLRRFLRGTLLATSPSWVVYAFCWKCCSRKLWQTVAVSFVVVF